MTDNTEPQQRPKTELPLWLWLFLPPGLVVIAIGAKVIDEEIYQTWIRSEAGLIENMTAVFLLFATVAGIRVVRRRDELPTVALGRWLGLVTLGCFYFLGEELSWGQHWFGWTTPDSYAGLNDQEETNLHNLHAVGYMFDQLPRGLLSVAAVVAGIIIPLRRRGRRRWAAADWRDWLWPTVVCVPTAILASVVRLPTRVCAAAGTEVPRVLDISPGETEEFALALMLLLYLLSIQRRLSKARST